MGSDVLPLSYLDKIYLILTSELRRALAYLYSEARLYNGGQSGVSFSVDYTTFYRQHLCVNEGSRPQQHMWNSKGFVLSRSNLLLHNSLHFQHHMKTKG
jgi:hypothetical protein